ncbi:pentapeptide repeat-containing protein [Paraburkholderia sp. RL18-101-BIB-B]|uniref:pentapeptide repeat-containing protein n=1 Tax=Paraburkholderia sp. RL18-101-BIB-B TaxID=3031634 RepID=UPI0038BCF77A
MTFDFKKGLSNIHIIVLVAVVLVFALAITLGAQYLIELNRTEAGSNKTLSAKDSYEISKLDAQIRQIRSDTAGSLFALKVIALFVTVGGAVGGYLIGQSRTTQARISFEDRKSVDEVYQSIIQELADESPILRAAAAVKLGSILRSFPAEWSVSDARREQLMQLTKQVLAAALSIETDKKVLKTLTINLVLFKAKPDDVLANVQGIDLSGAKGYDAYWARCDFSFADFYAANLERASFRRSKLTGAQFREATANNVIFNEADCTDANFKMADLRGASFSNATLHATNFEGARVHSVSLAGAKLNDLPICVVDISEQGDGSQLVSIGQWLSTTGNALP